MSFGFSVGDFLAIARVIKDIVTALRHGSASSYRELILELHGLQRALDEIEHMRCGPEQQAAVNSIKVAVLVCHHPLEEFAAKLEKFKRNGGLDQIDGHHSKSERWKLWGRKIQWGFNMEEEAMKLRTYIAAHVGSINMRLLTLGLSTSSIHARRSEETDFILQRELDKVVSGLADLRGNISDRSSLTSQSSLLKNVLDVISSGINSQLKTLLDFATRIWNSNMQIMAAVETMQTIPRRPDLRYTWYQEPVRFEDALGRILPIPSEYAFSKVECILMDQFITGPGADKVQAGEYILFNSADSSHVLSSCSTEGLIPGLSITMALVVGRYGQEELSRCPRIGCGSLKVERHHAGGRVCPACRAWFEHTKTTIPRPFRIDPLQSVNTIFASNSQSRTTYSPGSQRLQQVSKLNHARCTEGRHYKNVAICLTELERTPRVSNVRKRQRQSKQTMNSHNNKKIRLSGPQDNIITDNAGIAAGPENTSSHHWTPAPVMASTSSIPLDQSRDAPGTEPQSQKRALSLYANELEQMQLPSKRQKPSVPGSYEFLKPGKPSKRGSRKDQFSAVFESNSSVPRSAGIDFSTRESTPNAETQSLCEPMQRVGAQYAGSVFSEPHWAAYSHAMSIATPTSAPTSNFRVHNKPSVKIGRHGVCIRCRLLKEQCDQSSSCAGCKSSQARLWKVPCTRLKISELGYFLRSRGNLLDRISQDFVTPKVASAATSISYHCTSKTSILIDHGFGARFHIEGYHVPDSVRAMYNLTLAEDFRVRWMERSSGSTRRCSAQTPAFSCKDFDHLIEYVVRTLKEGRHHVFSSYDQTMSFNRHILEAVYILAKKTSSAGLETGLRLITAYSLAQCLPHVQNSDIKGDGFIDGSNPSQSRIPAPALVLSEVNRALANLCHNLHQETLHQLWTQMLGAYEGDRLEKWSQIFGICLILLVLWERMLFDDTYLTYTRPKEELPTEYNFGGNHGIAATKFNTELTGTPFLTITGLFQAISDTLPDVLDWNVSTRRRLHSSNPSISEFVTKMSEFAKEHKQFLYKQMLAGLDVYDPNNLNCFSGRFTSRVLLRKKQRQKTGASSTNIRR